MKTSSLAWFASFVPALSFSVALASFGAAAALLTGCPEEKAEGTAADAGVALPSAASASATSTALAVPSAPSVVAAPTSDASVSLDAAVPATDAGKSDAGKPPAKK